MEQRNGIPTSDRLAGLDWLRAGATVCVVLLHSGMPYCTHPLPGIVWTTYDPYPSPLVNVLTWGINLWVMPLFFLMSGFLAAGLAERHGPGAFMQHRLVRIGGLLLFGLLFILPLDLYAWLLSWVNQGLIEPVKLRSLKLNPPLSEGFWGPCHLWYLEYLLLYCLGAGVLSGLRRTLDARPKRRRGIVWQGGAASAAGTSQSSEVQPHAGRQGKPPERVASANSMGFAGRGTRIPSLGLQAGMGSGTGWSSPCLLTVAMLVLWLQPRVLIGFRHSFFPLPENFAFFAVWFTIGWQWFPRRIEAVSRRSALLRIAGGAAAFGMLLPMIHDHLAGESIPAANPALPALFVFASWLATTGLFQLALTIRVLPNRPVAYVAEASFWVYLLHHPVVALTQGNMAFWNWAAEVKFAVAALTGLAVPLLSYRVWVRGSRLGVLLNGSRNSSASLTVPQIEPELSRRAA